MSTTKWTDQEKELATNLREDGANIREISQKLSENGFERSPKAVERYFGRIGHLKPTPKLLAELEKEANIPNPEHLTTTWGEPLLTKKIKNIEFGNHTAVVPIMILPDIHAPFQDNRCINMVLDMIDIVKPMAIVYLGDNVDWVQLSRFSSDPNRVTLAQQEVDEFHKIDANISAAAGPDVKRYWLLGNHEKRMFKYVCEHPELSAFRGIKLDAILGLDKTFKPIKNLQIVADEIEWRERFLFRHGDCVRRWSGWSARAELDNQHMCGISGHVHRAGTYFLTNRGKTKGWYEGGCLCSIEPEYMENPNWQHAVTVGYFNGNKENDFFHLDQILINNYQAICNGKYVQG